MGSQPESKSIDEYLDQVLERMRGLRLAQVREIRQELRLHLEALVNSVEATGHSHDEALQIAFTRFGSPKHIADEMLRVSLQFQSLQFTKIFVLYALKIIFLAAIFLLTFSEYHHPNSLLWRTPINWIEILTIGCIVGSVGAAGEWIAQCLEMSLERKNQADRFATILPWDIVKKMSAYFGSGINPYRIRKLTWKDFILVALMLFVGVFCSSTVFMQKLQCIMAIAIAVCNILLGYIQASQIKRLAA